MKKFIGLFAMIALIGIYAFSPAPATLVDGPEISFEKETHDFGNIPQGTPISYEFKFTNTGNQDLIISDVQKVCGCTVTNWTKHPIAPGESGTVTAQYNAAKMGSFMKPITVVSNATNGSVKLYFKGVVVQDAGTPVNKTVISPDGQ